ncbi:YggS family pyridoxal phosphate-dependent enzyme [Synechococcus sp. RSCCF101]|uniref:YggS family pyridoxal phosphate-dependent enzyme n=1 Tax=Synechococcus sp. RSCCF101 TaxID=2511069 RepID=UPI001245FB9B|nr:YggS family pyridoxal phosphate-dependent enzyme [Synechococcus sp. RSCCF101]QEY32083.1 YggS family pyridoxal phosphate-dependent enzyme [Synechococcus sp. RSCCF101]
MTGASDSPAQRWQAIQARLPPSCRLLAVSKGQPLAAIEELAALGQRHFGESRLQEAQVKQDALAAAPDGGSGLDWHFIGRLQANKARAVLRRFGTIHSLDSLPLAERLHRIAGEEGRRPRVFLQVKLRPDEAKGGFSPEDLAAAWPRLQELDALEPVGLMTILPLGLEVDARRRVFAECRALADRMGLPECSMGMSGDWPEALEQGSTWLRLGSVLFGPRPARPHSAAAGPAA